MSKVLETNKKKCAQNSAVKLDHSGYFHVYADDTPQVEVVFLLESEVTLFPLPLLPLPSAHLHIHTPALSSSPSFCVPVFRPLKQRVSTLETDSSHTQHRWQEQWTHPNFCVLKRFPRPGTLWSNPQMASGWGHTLHPGWRKGLCTNQNVGEIAFSRPTAWTAPL